MCDMLDRARSEAIEYQERAALYYRQSSDIADEARFECTEPRRSELLADAADMQQGDADEYWSAYRAAERYRGLLDRHRQECGETLSLF